MAALDTPKSQPPAAWDPLTPAGVAAFSQATTGRVWFVQLVVALLSASVAVWFVHHAWFPVVQMAIRNAPEAGVIRGGELHWTGPDPVLLGENALLAISVDTNRSGLVRSPAHVQVQFESRRVALRSFQGLTWLNYPPAYAMAVNRTELEPWWGAWAPAILAGLGIGVTTWLMILWFVLATLYALPAWLLAFYANRGLTLIGSWRLCGAALLPAAVFLCAALVSYGFGAIDLVRLAAAFALHFVVGWVYTATAVYCLPRHPQAAAWRKNPFGGD